MGTQKTEKKNGGRLSTFSLALIVAVFSLALFYALLPVAEEPRDLLVEEERAYLALGRHGVRILDISNMAAPQEIGRLDTPGYAYQLALRTDSLGRQILFVADGWWGALALDVTDPAKINVLWRSSGVRRARGIVLAGDDLFVSDPGGKLHRFKVDSLPAPPEEVLHWVWDKATGIVRGLGPLWVDGNRLYSVRNGNQWVFFDISNRDLPQPAAAITAPAEILDLAIADGRVYLALGTLGVTWVAPAKGVETFGVEPVPIGDVHSLDVKGGYLYAGVKGRGVVVHDLSGGTAWSLVASAETRQTPGQLVYDRGRIILADGRRTVSLLGITDSLKQTDLQRVLSGYVADVAVHPGGYIYLANCEQGVQILTHQGERRGDVHDLPGCVQAVVVTQTHLFAAVRDRGVRVYSLTDGLETPKLLSEIGTGGAARDLLAQGQYVYVADGTAGLKVVDWALPLNQVIATLSFGEGADLQRIALSGDRLYLAAGSLGLQVVSIENPAQPQSLAAVQVGGEVRSVAVQAITQGDGENAVHAYLIGKGSDGQQILWVVDVSDPGKARVLSQVRLAAEPRDVAVDGRLVYVLEAGRGLQVYDVADPAAPQDRSPAPQEGDFNRLTVADHRVYVARATRGVAAYRVVNPEAPETVFSLDMFGVLRAGGVRDGYLYAVDGSGEMWVANLHDPGQAFVVSRYRTPGEARGLDIRGDYAYIADGSQGLRILQLGDGGALTPVGGFEAMDNARDVVVGDGYAFVVNREARIEVFDVRNPGNPEPLLGFNTRGTVLDLDILNGYLYVAEGDQGIEVWDVRQPGRPQYVEFPLSEDWGSVTRLEASPSGSVLYVLSAQQGLLALRATRPGAARLVACFASQGEPQDVHLIGRYVLFADGEAGTRVFHHLANDEINEVSGGPIPGYAANVLGINLNPVQELEFLVATVGQNGMVHLKQVKNAVSFFSAGQYFLPGRGGLVGLLLNSVTLPQVEMTAAQVFLGMLVFWLSLRLFLILASGQVLPLAEGWFSRTALQRLTSYIWGMHGPVVFVRDGKGEQRQGEFAPTGTGLVFIDAVSAAVLERRAGLPGLLGRIRNFLRRRHPRENLGMRPVGPGVNLIRRGERLRAVVDLRRQIRLRVGVTAKTADGMDVSSVVFSLFSLGMSADRLLVTYIGDDEKPENVREVQLREVSPSKDDEFTRQIVARLADTFDPSDKLEVHRYIERFRSRRVDATWQAPPAPPDWPLFIYNPERVRAAGVLGRAYNRESETWEDWTRMPLDIAVDIFRGLLERYAFDDLFVPDRPNGTHLRQLGDDFRQKMIHQGILAVQFVERADGKPIREGDDWREGALTRYPVWELPPNGKPLRGRGIRILHAGFAGLTPTRPEVMRDYRYGFWRSLQRKRVLETSGDYQRQALRIMSQARAQAQREMANSLLRILHTPGLSKSSLALRVFQALEAAATNPAAGKKLSRDVTYLLHTLGNLLLPGRDERRGDDLTPDDPQAE